MTNLAREFARRGMRVDLLATRLEGSYTNGLPPEVRIIQASKRVWNAVPRLAVYLRRERPDALLSTLTKTNLRAIVAGLLALTSTRVVIREANVLTSRPRGTRHATGSSTLGAVRCVYPFADAIIGVSRQVSEDIVGLVPRVAGKVRIIHNPIVEPRLAELAQRAVDHPWFAAGQYPVVLGAGRLHEQKDFPTLIKAFSIVRKQRPVRLVILGEGSERPHLEALVRELGIEDSVDLPGFQDNPYAFMARSRVFVLSSLWEGFGNVLVEALATGTPVVSTNCQSGPTEILEGGKCGLLVEPGNVESLARAIGETLDTEPDREGLRKRAGEFNVDARASEYLDVLLEGLLEGRDG
jgi:glycosyltransferase involved in cell wall biosynthesis